jgi:hypothetical protein
LRPRDPKFAKSDIADIVAAAGGRPLVFTEIGYPSAETLGRNADAQRDFYQGVFDALESHPDRIAGGSFFLMSDIPSATVRDLASYYNLPAGGAFVDFLGSLGVHDAAGAPKPAWEVFSRRAPALRDARACSSSGLVVNDEEPRNPSEGTGL